MAEEEFQEWMVAKAGHKEHLEELLKGDLRCRHLKHYCDHENKNEMFYDKNEGVQAILKPKQVKLNVIQNGQTTEVEDYTECTLKTNEILTQAAFCLSTILVPVKLFDGKTKVDKQKFIDDLLSFTELEGFGDYTWCITDYPEFKKRLFQKIDTAMELNYGLVQYEDFSSPDSKIISSGWEGFVKDIKFAKEKETRFLFKGNNLDDPYIIKIGDLSDISFICPTNELQNYVEVVLQE